MAKGLLAAEGIPVALLDRHAAWGFGAGPGAVRLLVPRQDVQRAQGLLAGLQPEEDGPAATPTPYPLPLGAWERTPDDVSPRGAVRILLWLAGLAATGAALSALL
ncbi:MAG TPA: DUF2007 domain-containing protein [Anaeromyxobacteraceae bacterium]|nr:DUF2007 domain-containing protein [Anaeromyxobacteraceae bacterium]